jgi:hypothetical protein
MSSKIVGWSNNIPLLHSTVDLESSAGNRDDTISSGNQNKWPVIDDYILWVKKGFLTAGDENYRSSSLGKMYSLGTTRLDSFRVIMSSPGQACSYSLDPPSMVQATSTNVYCYWEIIGIGRTIGA